MCVPQMLTILFYIFYPIYANTVKADNTPHDSTANGILYHMKYAINYPFNF
jgi:hypothetical protein